MKEFKEFLNEDKQPEEITEGIKDSIQLMVVNSMLTILPEKQMLKILSDTFDDIIETYGESKAASEFKNLKNTKISSSTYKKLERYLKNHHMLDV